MGNIPLEDRACVIGTYNRRCITVLSNADEAKPGIFVASFNGRYIGHFGNVRKETEKVYYKQLTLLLPTWVDAFEGAKRIAGATDPSIVEKLEAKKGDIFTADIDEAYELPHKRTMLFREVPYPHPEDEVKKFGAEYGIVFFIEVLEKEWLPF